MRSVLRHIAEGNLGRMQAPALEALGGRVTRNLKRLTDAIAAGALLIGGSMLVHAPLDAGWHHFFGEVMVVAGVFGTLLVGIAALRPDRTRGRGRR
jgi:ubiquinone biosynthesis protein